jgi:two-component sensor histidine kinase
MQGEEKVNILLVDDQPGKLMSYQVILKELGQNLLTASSANEALAILLKNDIAVLLVDVCMPELDGFEFAQMVREHPRFQKTAIIFISAIHLSDMDSLRGYEMGAVDYVPVPVVPQLLRAKVRVFVELYRKNRAMEEWNAELERRVATRTEELEQATKRQELLAREVDHRAKNALAVVQSIVRLTKAKDAKAFADAVHGRIRALAGAHALLSASRWAGASLKRLADEELAPYRTSAARAEIGGPDVMLRPDAAQAIAMVLHELATNAAKYGALSQDGGRVSLTWRVEGDEIEIEWRESGGPVVSQPKMSGFGGKVIKTSINDQLSGSVEHHWAKDGLRCTIRIPLMLRQEGPQQDKPVAPKEPRTVEERGDLQGVRVMVVEDEPVIAMMITDVLEENGALIVGPFRQLDEALACEAVFDVALLDVNLGGVNTFPLAQQLQARGCPFAFATGYDETGIDRDFLSAPVLQKPIEPHIVTQTLAGLVKARVRAA